MIAVNKVYGWAGRITRIILMLALRAMLRMFWIVPDNPVEPVTVRLLPDQTAIIFFISAFAGRS